MERPRLRELGPLGIVALGVFFVAWVAMLMVLTTGLGGDAAPPVVGAVALLAWLLLAWRVLRVFVLPYKKHGARGFWPE